MMARYAVVESAGMHGPSERVRADYTTDSLERARRRAAAWTRGYRRAMAPHGGCSGYYRVIESGGSQSWLGRDLDSIPSVAP